MSDNLSQSLRKYMQLPEMMEKAIQGPSDGLKDKRSDQKQEGRSLRIVFVGKTGAGKSATGNSILGRKGFDSKASLKAQTQESIKQTCIRQGREIAVVDTPGFMDPKTLCTDTVKEVSECVALSAPGPHAILVVMQAGRFTKEEEEAITIIQDLFGKNAAKYIVILFTRRDDIEADGGTVEEFIEEAEGKLKTMLENCGMRYCAFNNSATGEEQERQVSELLGLIDKMVEGNGVGYYSTEAYQIVERYLKNEEKKIRNKYLQEKQEAISVIKEKEKKALVLAKTEDRKELVKAEYAAEVDLVVKDYHQKEQGARAEAESTLLDAIRGMAARVIVTGIGAGIGGVIGSVGGPAGIAVGAAVGGAVGAAITTDTRVIDFLKALISKMSS